MHSIDMPSIQPHPADSLAYCGQRSTSASMLQDGVLGLTAQERSSSRSHGALESLQVLQCVLDR